MLKCSTHKSENSSTLTAPTKVCWVLLSSLCAFCSSPCFRYQFQSRRWIINFIHLLWHIPMRTFFQFHMASHLSLSLVYLCIAVHKYVPHCWPLVCLIRRCLLKSVEIALSQTRTHTRRLDSTQSKQVSFSSFKQYIANKLERNQILYKTTRKL